MSNFGAGVCTLLVSVLISAVSQIMLKKAADRKYENRLREYLNPLVIAAYGLFFISTILTMLALRYVPLAPSGRARCPAGGAMVAAGAETVLGRWLYWVAKSWLLYTTARTVGRGQAAGWMLPLRQMKFCGRAYSRIAHYQVGNFFKEVFQNDQEIH